MTIGVGDLAGEINILVLVVLALAACLLAVLAAARKSQRLLAVALACCAAAALLLGIWKATATGWVLAGLSAAISVGAVLLIHRGVRRAIDDARARAPRGEASAVLDELTGFYNGAGLASVGPRLAAVARRDSDALSALVIECDNLNADPELRDDETLSIAEALEVVLRASDMVARRSDGTFVALAKGPGLTNPGVRDRIQSALGDQFESGLAVPQIETGAAQLSPWDDGDVYDLIDAAERDLIAQRAR